MKAISFYYTTGPFLARRKDVTRRKRCSFEPGEHFNGVRQMQGLKKGQKREVLDECVCISNVPERVDEIVWRPVRKCATVGEWERARRCCRFLHYYQSTHEWTCGSGSNLGSMCGFKECPGIHEVDREGFPDLTPEQFAAMLKKMNRLTDRDIVQRVVFGRIA
jgi:hypothetical protein